MALKRGTEISYCVFVISCFMHTAFSSTPTLISVQDWYEVRDGSYAIEQRVDDKGDQWSKEVSLDRLEVLVNDAVLNMTFETCIEDKSTQQNKYADHAGQNSKFQEVHQVHWFSFYVFSFTAKSA